MTAAEKFTLQYIIFTYCYVIGRTFMCCASRFILGGAHLWAIYETKEKAEEKIRKIKDEDYGTSAWWNEEEVL